MSFCKLGISSIQKACFFRAISISYHVRHCSSNCDKLFAERLQNKCLIQLKGKDSPSLLQGLITNDINHLVSDAKAIYSMFLNNRGRVMFDSIIFKGREDDTYFLECHTNTVHSLERHLKKFKLRKKVSINICNDDYKLYSLYSVKEVLNSLPEDLKRHILEDTSLKPFLDLRESDVSLNDFNSGDNIIYRDPRLSALGFRIVVPKESVFDSTNFINPGDFELHRVCRYWLGIAEGSDELPFEECTPLESNCDYMHGVSFQKGCYVGQELTARSHHTGVIRKRIMPLLFDSEPTHPLPTDIKADESESAKKVGKLRGTYAGRYGIALLRINECLKLPHLHIGSYTAQCFKPSWWPIEASKIVKQEISSL